MKSIYRYNHKPTLVAHDNVERTYALNDEGAVVVCDYGKAERPHIPFPYFAEAWTGLEYTIASLMMAWGMVEEGVEIVRNVRQRHDGEKRNPWDEAECGHHYARAMSSWSTILALSGFCYDGATGSVIASPKSAHSDFECIWATGTAWGTYSLRRQAGSTIFVIEVLAGTLKCRSCEIPASGTQATVESAGRKIESRVSRREDRALVTFGENLQPSAKGEIRIEVRA